MSLKARFKLLISTKHRQVLVLFLCGALLGLGQLVRAGESVVKQGISQTAADKRKLANGFYIVSKKAPELKDVEPVGQDEYALLYDYHLLDPSEREAPCYVVLKTASFIPLSLAEKPQRGEDTKGKSMLGLQLSQDQVSPLERFTKINLGGTVAIVIGGDVVTMHQIKQKISGGRVQITRCSDKGCEVLFTELKKDHVGP